MSYHISIGILAHNDVPSITRAIYSLRQQSLFYLNNHQYKVEITLLAYDCTDGSAMVAERIFNLREWRHLADRVTCRVCSTAIADKSSAWNHYIHNLADPAANYIVMMDANIVFGAQETLIYLIQQLLIDTQAWVSIGRAIKHSHHGRHPALPQQIKLEDNSQTKGLSRQLYCARAYKLRQIWLPPGLGVEDGFLRAMILTDRFTQPENPDRIAFTPGASHLYEACTDWYQRLSQEKRIIIGTIVNQFIFDYLHLSCNHQLDAGTLIRRHTDRNPQWCMALITQSRRQFAGNLLQTHYLTRRFQDLRYGQSLRQQLGHFPIAIAASIADWAVFWRANRAVHQGFYD
jgi:hypothetical protein